jgi:Transglycosylase SLT domain
MLWLRNCDSCCFMGFARLLLTACFAVGLLAAQNGPAESDPFAEYHLATERQLSAILEHRQPQTLEHRESTTIEQDPAPSESTAEEIKAFAKLFWSGREGELAAALDRLRGLRPVLESILEREGVPRELVAVVLVESGAQPLAISPRHARGLWQFIPETARQYGLTVGQGIDERISVEPATRAATRYLRDLHEHFGDWPLALAAYNAGQNAVEGALKKGGASTFWQLSSAGLLPPETRGYVPAVLAAMQLLGPAHSTSAARAKAQREDWVYASTSIVN